VTKEVLLIMCPGTDISCVCVVNIVVSSQYLSSSCRLVNQDLCSSDISLRQIILVLLIVLLKGKSF